MMNNTPLIVSCFLLWLSTICSPSSTIYSQTDSSTDRFSIPLALVQGVTAEYVALHHLQLPTQPLASNFQTYSIQLEIQDTELNNLLEDIEDDWSQYGSLEGFEQVATESDFSIQFKVGKLDLKKKKNKFKMDVSDEEEKARGKSDNAFFYWRFYYELPLSISLIDTKTKEKIYHQEEKEEIRLDFKDEDSPTLEIIRNKKRTNSHIPILKPNEKRRITAEEVDKAWQFYDRTTLENTILEQTSAFLQKVGNNIRTQYDIRRKTTQLPILYLKKDHPHISEFKRAYSDAVCAISALRSDRPISISTQSLQKPIAFWEKMAANATTENKTEKHIKQVALTNLAVAYYSLDDMDKTLEYLDKLTAISKASGFSKFAKNFRKEVVATQKLLATNQVISRHYPLSNDNSALFALFPENTLEESDLPTNWYSGLIETKDGETLSGLLEFDKNNLLFNDKGILFIDPENVYSTELYCPQNIKNLHLDKSVFEPKLCKEMIGSPEHYRMLERVSTGRIVVYHLYYNSGYDVEEEIVPQKLSISDKLFVQKDGGETLLLTKNQLVKFIEDAPDLLKKWQDPYGYEKGRTTEAAMLEAIKDYNAIFANEAVENEKVNLKGFNNN